MANKTDRIDLDDFDWDDWGDISATGEGEWKDLNKKQKARKAVTHLKGGFVSGIRDRLLSKEGQRKYINKALPKEYGVAYDTVIETYDAVADVYDEASKEISELSKKTGSALKPLVDKYNSRLPKKLREPLRKWTQNALKTNKNWDEGDRDEIQAISQVNDIFAKQEANRLHQKEVIEQKAQTSMLKNQNSVLIELLKTAKASRGYELEVDYVYKRKTLELQYRQFAIQRKILDVQQQTMKLQEASFEKIIHNTGLPDFVKINTSEVAKQMMVQKVFGDAINNWGEVPTRLIQNMIKNTGKKITNSIKGTGGQGTDILSLFVQMLTQESMTGDPVGDRIESGARTSMNILEWLLNRKDVKIPFGPKIEINAPLARAFEKARKNEKVVAGAHRLKYIQRYGNRKFKEVAAGGSTGHSWLDSLLELSEFRSLVGNNVTTIRKSSRNLNEAALFDIGTKKAITEVIPGYLSRIHWELIAQRTGKTNHSLMTFDHTKNKFTSIDKLVNSSKDDIYDKNRGNVNLVFKDIFKKMGFNRLSKPAQEAIQRTMVLRALEGQSFDLSVLMNDRATSTEKYGLDYKVVEEIQRHLETNKGFNRTNQNVYTSANGQSIQAFKAMDDIATAMNQLQQGIMNPLQLLRDNVAKGQDQVNRRLGITQWDDEGNQDINVAKYVSGLLGHEFTAEELRANRKHAAPTKKKKKEEMNEFERLQSMAEQENEGGSDGTGFSKGGYTGDYSTKTPVGSVHGQEYVFDAQTVKRIGVKTLDKIKSGAIKVTEKSSQFNKVFDAKKGKNKLFDILAKAKISFNPVEDLEKAKEHLIEEIFIQYYNLSGTMPNTIADLKRRAKSDVRLRILMSRLETLDRLKNSSLSKFDKAMALKNLADNWNSVSIGTFIEKRIPGLRRVKDDATEKAKQGQETVKEKFNNFSDGAKSIWDDLSSYRPGSGKTSDNNGIVKETLITLAKGAFGVGTELAKARFYGLKIIPWGLKKILGGMVHRDSFKFLKYGLWLQNGKEIKLYATGLKEGRYLNGNMEVIEKPNDIHGNIYDTDKLDADGQPSLILTAWEYRKGLFDHEGKQIVKPSTFVSKIAKGLTNIAWKTTKFIGKGLLYTAKKYIAVTSWPGRKLIDLIIRERKGKIQDPEALAQITMQDLMHKEQKDTNAKLDKVVENLEHMSGKNKKFNDSDGDGDRDGNAIDKLNAFRDKFAKNKEKAQSANPLEKKQDKKESFMSKALGLIKDKIGGIIGGVGGLIGMLVKGGIMAVLGTFGIKSLLGWLSGKGEQEKIDPNDPRLDPTSPQYDPEFGQPTMLQKGAGWALEKMNGMNPLAQAGIGLAGGYAAWKGAKFLAKGAGKLAVGGVKALAGRLAGGAAASTAANAAAGTVARQGFLQGARSLLARQGLRTAGAFIAKHGAMQAIRSGIAAAGTAIGSTVGLPVVLGVAAVAALGYGAYKLYKNMKKNEVMITRARMASYGYEVDNEKKVTKLLEIEGYLLEHASVSDDGKVAFKEGTSEAKLQEYFNVNPEDKESLEKWKRYFFQRFLPVFVQFLTAYKKHTGKTDLHKAEESMDYRQMSDMLTDTLIKKGTENNPYTIMESGFAGDDKVELDKEEVFDIYATIATKLRNLVQKGSVNKRQKERTKESKQIAKEAERVEAETAQEPKKSVFERVKDAVKTAAGYTLPGLVYRGVTSIGNKLLGRDSTTNPGASSWLSGLWNKTKEVGSNIVNTLTGNSQSSSGSAGGGSANTVVGKSTITKARDIFVAMAKKQGKSNKWIQSYLANMHRETGGFTVATENMNYKSAARIREIYGKTIRKAGVSAESLVNNPVKLANVVMDDRINNKGLGNKYDGDGYKYRGRGLFQITGRDAYAKVGAGIGVDLVGNPDLMNDPNVMAKAALWYATNYKPASGDSLEAVTKSIAPGKYQYNLDEAKKHVSKYNDATINQMAVNGGASSNSIATPATPVGTNTVLASNNSTKTPVGTNTVLAPTAGTNAAKSFSPSFSITGTINKVVNDTKKVVGASTALATPPPASTGGTMKSGTPWMDIAKKELGVSKPSARVGQYASETGSGHLGNNYHYCATFVRWCLKQAGCDLGASNPMAKSFKGYGQAVDPKNPPYGAVIVMHWGNGKYHVAFSGGMKSDGTVVMLGGNQSGPKGGSDRTGGVVTESAVSTRKIEYAGFPNGYNVNGGQQGSGETTAQSAVDTGATESKPTKAYAFKVTYMDFNNKTGRGLKGSHEVTVRDIGESTVAVAGNAGQVGASGVNTAPVGIVRSATGTTNFNVQKFVQHLTAKGLGKSIGLCARYVMNALNAGGIPNSCRQPSAYLYPNALLKHGFHEISMNTTPQAGDIVVNDRMYNGKSKHGHIQGFTGTRWISDFKQNRLVTAKGRMFRHASLANKTPVANKELTKPASGTNDSKKDNTNVKTNAATGSSLNSSASTGKRTTYTGIGTFKTGYNSKPTRLEDKKSDAGALANAGYAASLGLGKETAGSGPLGNLSTINGQPTNSSTVSTLKYELINSNGKRALSFTLKDGSKFIVELDAIGPEGRKTKIDDKEVLIKRDGTVTDYHSSSSQSTNSKPQTPEQMAQSVNGKLNPDGSITYPGPDGKPITVNPKDVGPAGHKTHTGVVLFSKQQLQMPASSATDIKRALDIPGTYVDIHGIVRNPDGSLAMIAGKPVSVTTKDGNLTTTITRTPYYKQKLPPELQKLEEERQKHQTATKPANKVSSTTSTSSKPANTTKPNLAQAQEKAKQEQQRLQEQLARQKANELRTQQMKQAQIARQNQETLSTINALNEQLKVQRSMLQTLQSIDKHLSSKSDTWKDSTKNTSTQSGTESTVTSNGQSPGLQIKGIPKSEPMSMNK